jgi:hypothetical protein
MTTPAPSTVRERGICVIIKTSRFSTKRTVRRNEVRVEALVWTPAEIEGKVANPDQEALTVAKELLDSPQLRAITLFDSKTKGYIRRRSVPSPLLRSGAYMFAVEGLPEIYAYLETRKAQRTELETSFEIAYPALIEAAKVRLGPLFEQSQYPPLAVVKREFTFDWQVVEISTPDAKLQGISQVLFEKEKAKAEQVWTNAIDQINDALTAGMAEVVGHLAERLSGKDDGKAKVFKASTVQNVQEFLDTFAQRNLTDNADLTKLVEQAKGLLAGVDIKELRKDEAQRVRLAADFSTIKKTLDTMLEIKPTRAISLASDEEV